MKILFIGDVVGQPGREAVKSLVPALKQQHNLDLVIANGENSANGAGLTPGTVKELLDAGVEAITTGDHVWDKKEINQIIESEPRLLRPLNFPPKTPGRGSLVVLAGGKMPVAVVSLIGRVFMKTYDCPFRAVEQEINRLRRETSMIFVDFHAEATSEKIALGRFLDGKVTAVMGTHTHVPTADECVLPGGTAYISDVGMCGPHDSVLGRDTAAVVRRFVTQLPQKLEVATGQVELCGVIVDADENDGKARSIQRVRVPLPTGVTG
jgi:metallophosphoesterase (TIGR00282 family)